jgi:hypothetical protein
LKRRSNPSCLLKAIQAKHKANKKSMPSQIFLGNEIGAIGLKRIMASSDIEK